MTVHVPFVVTTLAAAPITGLSAAWDINDRGDVAGEADEKPFVWRPTTPNGTTGAVTFLSPLPAGDITSGMAVAINRFGDVVGSSEALDAFGNHVDSRAVLWAAGGPPQDLGTLIPVPNPNPAGPPNFLGNSKALDIDDNRRVVGLSDTVVPGTEHAFLLDTSLPFLMTDIALTPLDILPAGTTDFSQAAGINNHGTIVGEGTALDSQGNVTRRAFLSSTTPPFTRTPLGTLISTGPVAFLGESAAYAVENSSGRVAGDSSPAGGGSDKTPVQFKLGPSGTEPDLLAPAFGSTYAFSDAGVIVGFLGPVGVDKAKGDPGHPDRRGFAYDTTDGSLTDLTSNLTTPGVTILEATGVNAAGQLSAIATGPGGQRVGVLLSPQP